MSLAIIFTVLGSSLAILEADSSSKAKNQSFYPATKTQDFSPTAYPAGPVPGPALIVYDPGPSGTAETIAEQMVSILQTKGYFIILTGIDSQTAKLNASQCQLIIVGGPIVNGEASTRVQTFLKSVDQGNRTLMGVYGVTDQSGSNDQVAPSSVSGHLNLKESQEINAHQDLTVQSDEFVTKLLS